MPNGKPGDHPLTDIVAYRRTIFGSEIDDKVRRVNATATATFQDVLATLVAMWPWAERAPVAPRALSAILDSMLQYAEIQRRLNDKD
jgi:hypothetical protein